MEWRFFVHAHENTQFNIVTTDPKILATTSTARLSIQMSLLVHAVRAPYNTPYNKRTNGARRDMSPSCSHNTVLKVAEAHTQQARIRMIVLQEQDCLPLAMPGVWTHKPNTLKGPRHTLAEGLRPPLQ